MLRNLRVGAGVRAVCLLNEVLSLNAQESLSPHSTRDASGVLNEVLSLNAQEYR